MQTDADLSNAGVLVRQFDMLEDPVAPWLPCPQTGPNSWCKALADRWSASLLYADARALYLPTQPGIVLAPTVRLNCAYAVDGNSMHAAKSCKHKQAAEEAAAAADAPPPQAPPSSDEYVPLHTYEDAEAGMLTSALPPSATPPANASRSMPSATAAASKAAAVVEEADADTDADCLPGCYPPDKQCYSPGWWATYTPGQADAYASCSFPPSQLAAALHTQQELSAKAAAQTAVTPSQASARASVQHNEIVVDTASVVSDLPRSIVAFFFLSTSSPEEIATVQASHERFLVTSGLMHDRDIAPPLLLLDLDSEPITEAALEEMIASGTADSLADAAKLVGQHRKPLPFSVPDAKWFA